MGKKDKKIIITTESNNSGKFCEKCPNEKKNCKCQNKK